MKEGVESEVRMASLITANAVSIFNTLNVLL